jgi:MFS transporter, DHA3 family, macrolide efflux protein
MVTIASRRQKKIQLPTAARWMLTSILITNVGNGMHTLTIGKLLYDRTGSAAAFGIVIIVEYVTNFLFNILAGSVVDRGDPKTMCVRTDFIRGAFICFASLMVASAYAQWWVLASVIVINVAKPFYRSATFSIGPAIASSEELLTKYNALSYSFLQIGQLLGVALVGPIMQYFGTGISFGLNGFSYLIAGFAVWVARVPPIERKGSGDKHSLVKELLDDWKEMGTLLRSNLALGCHIVVSIGDYIAVILVNLALVPIVDQWYGGNALWLSALDGSFAIGAIMAAGFASTVMRKLRARNAACVGLGGQAVLFALLSAEWNPYLAMVVMIGIGAMSGFSLTIFISTLQRRIRGPIKGRIASIRDLTTTVFAVALIPIVTDIQGLSLERGLLTSAIVCVVFSIVTFILGRSRVLGDSLLIEPEHRN